MALREWLAPPRHLIALFLLVTLLPSLALVALGWRLLEQDRALSLQQLSERREQAADLAVSELDRVVSATAQALRDPEALRAAVGRDNDSVGVIFERERLEVFPNRRLTFYPRTEAGSEAPAQYFDEGEALEFRRRSWPDAIAVYRGLARSSDPVVRAGALIRLARTLRKTGAHEEALKFYAEAGQLSGTAVDGVPADLLARWAHCDLLDSLRRRDELENEAHALHTDLINGRWHLDRATYDLHAGDVRRWTKADDSETSHATGGRALAVAVERLWDDWRRQAPDRGAGSGRHTIPTVDARITVLWERTDDRMSALLVSPAFVERQWLARLMPALDRQRLRLALRESGDRGSGHEFADRGPVTNSASKAPEALRLVAETGLPWTVVIDDLDPQGELARVERRKTLWLWGLVILVGVASGGIVIIARSVTRELTVARLQSDFVSAVSHEFRTPLTSLRQLTEMLLDGRVIAEERRETYYRAAARQTERLHRLVEGLLDFGRMEAGTSPYQMAPIDACALVRSVVDEFEQDSAASGYHVELQVDGFEGATLVVAGDREALTHAVWNLLDNAVKYSPTCRTVWVDVAQTGSRLNIRVRDRGLGIPTHEHRDVFKRFVRGAGAKAHGIRGTGVGLAMVRHIVSAHGGQVDIESREGMGSTFTIVLPLQEGSAGLRATATRAPEARGLEREA